MPPDQQLQQFSILARGDRPSIAYRRVAGSAPSVVFLCGYRSDMSGEKALALEAFSAARGLGFLRFDYTGHGQSGGDFLDGSITGWLADSLDALDRLTEGPLVLVGSSMGGWLMLLAALERKSRVAGLVGIASAPDFTEELMWPNMAPPVREALMKLGVIYRPSAYSSEPYPVTRLLIESGRRHLLLGGAIDLDCPVRLLHGTKDPDVPWETSIRLAERLASTDVAVTLIKDAGHRLNEPDNIATILRAVEEVVGKL
ncbi:MAG: alpha/beta hydrolase [Alphaproteobacteria bacterium]|nr:alpha/beta hydrolase [Alphaproteobacteria bacterium]